MGKSFCITIGIELLYYSCLDFLEIKSKNTAKAVSSDKLQPFLHLAHVYLSIQQQCCSVSLNSDTSQETLFITSEL